MSDFQAQHDAWADVAATILTRDATSGRIHKRYRTATGLIASIEGDNLDDAGAYEIIETVEGAEPDDLCRNCFPDPIPGLGEA